MSAKLLESTGFWSATLTYYTPEGHQINGEGMFRPNQVKGIVKSSCIKPPLYALARQGTDFRGRYVPWRY